MSKLIDFFLYLITPLLVLVGILDVFLKGVEVVEQKFSFEYPFWDYSPYTYGTLSVLGLVLGAIWYFREKGVEKSTFLHLRAERFIRIWMAFMMASYGFAKVLKTQFQVPEFIKDMPVGELHPFYLTWHYFGFSREYVLILAAAEIGGAVLILFQNTRLLGALILFPTLINIVFIDLFYQISPEALMVASYLALGSLYLLLLDFEKLRSILPSVNAFGFTIDRRVVVNWGIRIIVISAAYGLIWMYANDEPYEETYLNGVWAVDQIMNNSDDPISPNQRDSVLTKIYFQEKSGQTILEFNHRYRKHFTSLELSDQKDSLNINFGETSAILAIAQIDSGKIELQGLYQEDTLKIVASKLR